MTREQRIQVAQLRATAQTIGKNIDDMESIQVRTADRSNLGWNDPKIAAIELDIEAARADRQRVLDKVAAVLATPRKVA